MSEADDALALSKKYESQQPPEYQLALELRDKAAELGNPEAQYSLGQSLLFPRPTRDPKKGVAWVEKAANQGWLPAILELATLYRTGKDVKRDELAGEVWLMKAAEKGDPESLMEAASIAETRGNFPETYLWLRLAADVYADGAIESLKELTERIAPEDLETGKQRVDAFKAEKRASTQAT